MRRGRTAAAGCALLLATACGGGNGEPASDAQTDRPSRSPSPPSPPSPSSPPSPAAPAEWDVSAAFLPPAEAARLEQPGWGVNDSSEPEAGPLLDPCGDGTFPRGDDVVASNERTIESSREAGGSVLAQEVFRYRSAEAARQATDAYAAEVARCSEVPAEQSPEGYTTRFSVVDDTTGPDGVRRLLVQRQPCMSGGQCTQHFRSYLFVAHIGNGVTTAHYGLIEDGDPREWAGALLDATAAQLAEAVGEE